MAEPSRERRGDLAGLGVEDEAVAMLNSHAPERFAGRDEVRAGTAPTELFSVISAPPGGLTVARTRTPTQRFARQVREFFEEAPGGVSRKKCVILKLRWACCAIGWWVFE